MKKYLINEKIVSAKDTRTKFSFKSPTPQWASNLFNIVMTISAILTLIIVTYPEYINDKTEDLTLRTIAISLPVLRIVTKAFGIEVKEK